MPKSVPDFLAKMIRNIESGVTVKGKNGNLEIRKSFNGQFVTVIHFGTKILELDFWKEGMTSKVVYQYGQSQTDARYINAILYHYNLDYYFDVGYGNTNGWRFIKVKDDEGNDLEKKDWVHDFNYEGMTPQCQN